jgi:hypothetical protein
MALTEVHVHDVYVTTPTPGWLGPVLWCLLALVLAAGAGVIVMSRRRARARVSARARERP